MANRWVDLNLTTKDEVTELYVATLGRAPDKGGLDYWTTQVATGKLTIVEVANSFFDQPETQAKYPASMTTTDFVNAIYNNALGRPADAVGLAYWVDQLDTGTTTRSNFILAFLQGAYDDPTATPPSYDSSLLTNQHVAGEFFASISEYPWTGTSTQQSNFLATADTVLNPVVGDPATGPTSVMTSESLSTAFASAGFSGFALTSPGTVVEGNGLVFTLTAAAASAVARTFNVSLLGNTLGGTVNATDSTDFVQPVASTVTIAANATTGTVTIATATDNKVEGLEGFSVNVLQGATPIANASAVINDSPVDSQAPVVTASQTLAYAEGVAAGVTLGTVAATDNTGVTGFALASGNDKGYFAIDNAGVVTLTAAGAAAGSPAESSMVQPNTFTVAVTANDAAGNVSAPTNVTLNVLDTTPPVVGTTSLAGSSLVMTFNEALDTGSVPAGSSFTVLQNATTAISVNSVTVNGSTVTLGLATQPTGTLTVAYTPPQPNTTNPLQDVAGNDAAAIPAKNVVIDNTPPSITTFNPADAATAVPRASDLVLTFSEPVFLNGGTITLTNPNTASDTRTITITNGVVSGDGTVVVSGNTATIDLTTNLSANVNYNVAIANGTFKDAAGNAFVGGGIPSGNGWDFTTATVTGQDFTLTTGQDTFPGTLSNEGNDVIRGVAGVAVGQQDQTTLNSSDFLDGGTASDTLVLLLNGNYGGGATIKNIETLQIGSNTIQAGGVNFDYNVNQGVFEVVGINTIVADQITTGEILNVNNIVPTAASPANVTPTLSWENEAGSRAGTFGATYRQAATNGTADNQAVVLKNVNALNAGDGILNIGAGMESITIESSGSVANNTLNYSANLDTGNNAVPADVVSVGSLTKVVLKGGVDIGKIGGVVTDATGARAVFQGMTDRVVGVDTGLTADATTNPTESNLLSVGSRVTEVDATLMTGAADVRFVAKADASATNVTFKGGAGNDYAEFELGNVTATGGDGNDTFAFINAGANGTFGEADKIDGGTGSDTLQLGLNGNAQIYNIGETELSNVSSVETIDLRGQTNFLTLSAGVVSKSDTANTLTVRTDKVIQGSATDSANPVNWVNNGLENAATATVNLTKLTSGQGVTFLGGSGSDRLILSDATFNVNQSLDGGVYNDTALRGAGSNRYDTITVVTNGENVVIDGNDLSKVKNFEGFVLTKNAAAATYNITLTQTFLTNNTQGSNNPNTAINDTIFQIGTSAAANNSALSAGDTVIIDVRNLLNATDNGLAAGFSGRFLDVTALQIAGATVTFIGNTGNLTLAQVQANTPLLLADANFADVTTASAANPGAVGGANLIFVGNGGNTTSGFEIQGNLLATSLGDLIDVQGRVLTAAAVLNGSAGVDTLVATNGADISLAGAGTVTSIEALNLTGAITMTQAQHTGIMTAAGSLGIIAPGGADQVNMAVAGPLVGGTDARVETYNFTTGFLNGNVTGASVGVGGQTFIMAGNFTVADTLTGGAGAADVMQTNVAVGTAFTDIDNVSGIETIQLTQAAGGSYAWTPSAGSAFVTDTTVVTFNATALTTSTLVLDLSSVNNRGVVVNLANNNVGVDVVTVSTTVANIVNAHAVSGLSAGDTIDIPGGAVVGTTYTVDLATFNAATFPGAVNAALAALAAYTPAPEDLVLVRIGGSNANVYAVRDIIGDGVDNTDGVVHLVGTQNIPIDGTVIV